MFKMHEIREMIKLIDQSSIHEFEIELDGAKLSMKKSNGAPVTVTNGLPVHSEAVVAAAPVSAVQAAVPEPAVAAVETEPAQPSMEQAALNDPQLHTIVSPMVGTFYHAPEPGAAPYVQAGDKVSPNSVVCIVEAMKLFNEIEAEVSGEVVKVLVEDGQLIDYGQPLFLVKPE